MEHPGIWRALLGFAVVTGSVVSAVVPDEFVGVAATIGAGLLAWTASTLWKSAATLAKIEQRLDEHDRRIGVLETN